VTRDVVLGIDFGSSSTVSGAIVGDRIELVQDAGDPVIPTVVYLPDRGAPEVGRKASARQLVEPSKVVRSVKRVLGVPSSHDLVRRYAATAPFRLDTAGERPVFKLRSGDLAPEQVAATVLTRVRELAEARFGGRISKVVMAMSADAPPGYRASLQRAAKIAHLDLLDVIAEPIAGVLALDLHREQVKRKIVVCDFGGGTFDVSAVAQDGARFSPVATLGDHYLGGDDLDHALAEAIAGLVVRNSGYDMHRDAVRWTELLMRCESAKRQLSTATEVPLSMRDAYLAGGQPKNLQLTLDIAWVERAWAELMDRVRRVVGETVRAAGWSSVDVVGLIGGSSLVPSFRRAIADMFPGVMFTAAHQAELAVAQGATILTARYTKAQVGPVLVAS
jgi:molecular chaperone DnaK (HSP70)